MGRPRDFGRKRSGLVTGIGDHEPMGENDVRVDSEKWRDLVARGAAALGVTVSGEECRRCGIHASLLLEWNRSVNLTAITDPEEVALKHAVDSLAAVPWIPEGARVVDIGSGGGFPGVALAVVRPDIRVVMVDGARKKVSFLKHVIASLKLTNASAWHGRIEDLPGTPAAGDGFDLAVCRAFSSLDRFVDLALPVLVPGGGMLALKGELEDAELAELERRHPEIRVAVTRYALPFRGDRRAVARISLAGHGVTPQ